MSTPHDPATAIIETIDSRTVYENRWMRVREDRIRRPSGAEGIYGVVEKPDFAVIAPIDAGRVHLVQQYRYPVGQRFWEFPQGSWEGQPDIDPTELAIAELREETGLVAGHMQAVGHLFAAYGYSTQGYHVYLASQLSAVPGGARDAEEEDLISRAFSLQEVEAMILAGELKDATTVAVLGLLRMKGLI